MKLRDYPGTSFCHTRNVAEVSTDRSQWSLGGAIVDISHLSQMGKTENLDDFEQKFLRFTIALKEFCETSLYILDEYSGTPEFQDKMANVLIGMKEYIDASESNISEDIENHIRRQYERIHYATADENGVIQLPPEMVEILGWKEGDTLKWTDLGNDTYKLTKVV